MKTALTDPICGNCKNYDSDNCYCMATGKYEMYEEDTCDDWREDDSIPE